MNRLERTWAVLISTAVAGVALWFLRSTIPLDVLTEFVLPWCVAGCVTLTTLGAGYPIARLLLGRETGALPITTVLGTGAAILALIPVGLASLGWLRPAPLIGILLAAGTAGIAVGIRDRHRISFPAFRISPAVWCLLLILVAAAGLTLAAPPVMYDSLNYHLAFPAQYLRHGRFVEFPRDIYSYYPASEGALSTYMLVTLGGWGAKVIHWWMAALAALAASELAEHVGGARAGAWAAVLFFSSPPVLIMSGMASNDLAVAAWAGSAFVLLTRRKLWRRHPAGAGALAGILLGTAVAAKYLALATVVIPGGIVLGLVILGQRRKARASTLLGVAGACIAGFLFTSGPWFLRNVLWTGDPLYPYLTSLFHTSAAVSIGSEISQCGAVPNTIIGWLSKVVTAPILRTFVPLQLGGTLGVQFLILLPAAAVLSWKRWAPVRSLWISLAVGTVAWGSLVTFARFATPELILAAALAGWAFAAMTSARTAPRVRQALFALLVFVVAWNLTYLSNRFNMERLLVVTGVEKPEAFLDHWASYWPAARWIDAHLPARATILLVGEPRSYGIERDVVVEDPFRTPLLIELARGSRCIGDLINRLRARGITHILVDPVEMRRIARQRGLAQYWSEARPAQRRLILELFETGVDHLFEGQDGVWVGKIRTPAQHQDGSRADPEDRAAKHALLPRASAS